MRNRLLMYLLALYPCWAAAQFIPHQKFIGGTVGFNWWTNAQQGVDNNSSEFDFSLSPRIGYLLSPRMALGATLQYARSERDFTSAGQPNFTYLTSYGLSPFLRIFFPVHARAGFMLEPSINLAFGSGENAFTVFINPNPVPLPPVPIPSFPSTVEEKTESFSYGLSVQPHLYYFFTDEWQVELGLGSLYFSQSHEKRLLANSGNANNKATLTQAGFSLRPALRVGINYFWGGTTDQD